MVPQWGRNSERNFDMSDLTPVASWDAVIQLAGTMSGVPATWNVPNQALLNRTEWLKTWGIFKDADGNLLMQGGTIGYGAGSGGVVTQATSKSTGVTLNKQSGTITMSGAALAAGASVSFTLTNTLITPLDILDVAVQWGAFTPENYRVRSACGSGVARITLENVSGGSLSEALPINFALKRVANT